MPREKVDGVNLREEIMEVAFEQWTERRKLQVDFNVFPHVTGERYRKSIYYFPYRQSAEKNSLNLGGNTDI